MPMNKVKSQKVPARRQAGKVKTTGQKLRFCVLTCGFAFLVFSFAFNCFAQAQDDLELTLDINSSTAPLPRIFQPNIDLSGRGFNADNSWPQNLASKEALESWKKDIGFGGLYRIQYNLWEISQLGQQKEARDKLLANYETVIKNISDAGGTVILNMFGTPAGMGKILDKKSSPLNLAAFKDLIKGTMKDLSCDKKYNIWYEAWNAPDLEDFFLGADQDYFNIYRAFAESAKELEAQYKVHIPVGAPGASSWFHNLDKNTVFTPGESLIYGLIKFCYQNRLGIDFISWHGFSTDPKAEKENTIYNKNAAGLVRDWLSYFNFDKNMPIIIDEWNYDRDANILPERSGKSYVAASFIPSRLKNMHEAGLDNQVYFCLEDFQDNKEGVTRNVGAFYFRSGASQYKGGPKAIYNVFRMLKECGPELFSVKLNDEFVGVLATKAEDRLVLLIYNYIDPEIMRSRLSENISGLNPAESKFLLNVIRSDKLAKITSGQEELEALSATPRVKLLLKSAVELYNKAKHFETVKRLLKINLSGLKGDYHYSLFTLDSSCSLNCDFKVSAEKDISVTDSYQDELALSPYSVNLIILQKKPEPPQQPEIVAPAVQAEKPAPAAQPAPATQVEQPAPEQPKPDTPKQPAEPAKAQEPLKDAAGV